MKRILKSDLCDTQHQLEKKKDYFCIQVSATDHKWELALVCLSLEKFFT